MKDGIDVRDAGDGAMLLRLPAVIDPKVNARAVTIAAHVRDRNLTGIRDVVPTFHSVAVHFDPLRTDVDRLIAALRAAVAAPITVTSGRSHQVPVIYGGEFGPDLDFVADQAGITTAEVVRRHAAVTYRVFMLGFQPGFAYLGLLDPLLATPRRASPRVRVPEGAVGMAGRQTAVYPAASPGGWQIIGQSIEPVFDVTTATPRFAPGDAVSFVATRTHRAVPRVEAPDPEPLIAGRTVTVVKAGLLTTVQARGRWGRQHEGFPVSGAMDVLSHSIANAAVGNDPGAATLEVTIDGPQLHVDDDVTMAVAGADVPVLVGEAEIPGETPIEVAAGSTVRVGHVRAGARAYLAFAGGIRDQRRSPAITLKAGQVLSLDTATRRPHRSRTDGSHRPSGNRLRVLPGPQDDLLPATCFAALLRSRFRISPQSNRIGYRLTEATLPSSGGQMISDATFAGGIQVTPSGEPILLMADRPTTGGYPQVATVITADLPIAAQLKPGDWVEFDRCSRAEAIAALVAQEATIRRER